MKTPSQLQNKYLIGYGKLLIQLQKEIYPDKSIHHASGLLSNIRNSHYMLAHLFDHNPFLPLRKYFIMRQSDKEYISVPKITVCSFLIGRLTQMDEECCYLSLLVRLSSIACKDLSLQDYVSLVKIMIGQGALVWACGDDEGINPHLSLSKPFINTLWGTEIGATKTKSVKPDFLPPIPKMMENLNRKNLEFLATMTDMNTICINHVHQIRNNNFHKRQPPTDNMGVF